MLYGIIWFLFLYLFLLYFGEKVIFFDERLVDQRKEWFTYIVVGLIISGSSLLTKMFLGWLREMRGPSQSFPAKHDDGL